MAMLQNANVHPTVPTTNIDRARTFYGKTLGLKEKPTPDKQGLWYDLGSTSLYVYERGPSKADHTLCTFQVKDVAAEVEDLRKAGVKFEEYDLPEMGIKTVNGVATTPEGMKIAWFKDPDGNILALGSHPW